MSIFDLIINRTLIDLNLQSLVKEDLENGLTNTTS
jgi:hypothetical protein